MFSTGSKIEIKATDNVLSRFPHFVGKKGVITSSPTHPSTWFSVRIDETDTVIKLQTTAMVLLEAATAKDSSRNADSPAVPEGSAAKKASSSSSSATATNSDSAGAASRSQLEDGALLVQNSKDQNVDEKRPRSHSLGHIIQCSQAPALKKGVGVTILRTENVAQRAPHLVGRQGVVKEVPVHPATWFKVEFPDKSVFTFRPSALVVTSDIPSDAEIDWGATIMSASPSTGRAATRVSGGSEDAGGGSGSRKRNNSYDDRVYDTGGAKRGRKRDSRDKDRGKKHAAKASRANGSGMEEDDSGSSGAEGGLFDSDFDSEVEGAGEAVLLTGVDPDSWVGRLVRVKRSGGAGEGGVRHAGHAGTVLKSGNGWVQVQLSSSGEEIAKRAYELEVVHASAGRRDTHGSSSRRSRGGRNGRSSGSSSQHASSGGNVYNNSSSSSHRSSRNAVATGAGAENAAAIAFANIGVGSYGKTNVSASAALQIDMSSIRNTSSNASLSSMGRPRSFSEPMLTPNSSYYGVPSPKLFFLGSSPRPNSGGSGGMSKSFSFGNAAAVAAAASGSGSTAAESAISGGNAKSTEATTRPDSASAADAPAASTDKDQDLDKSKAQGAAEKATGGAAATSAAPSAEASRTTRASAAAAATAAASSTATAENGPKKYFIKKVSPLLIQAKREWAQKYVARTQEKIENRPDLTYWRRAITSSIMVDSVEELRACRRDAADPAWCCPCCRMERWNGGLFCWNEKCRISPIYWKLPGARGVPPAPPALTVPPSATAVPQSLDGMTQQVEDEVQAYRDRARAMAAASSGYNGGYGGGGSGYDDEHGGGYHAHWTAEGGQQTSPSTTAAVFSAGNSANNSGRSDHGDADANAVARGVEVKIPPLFDYSYPKDGASVNSSAPHTTAGGRPCAISLLSNVSTWTQGGSEGGGATVIGHEGNAPAPGGGGSSSCARAPVASAAVVGKENSGNAPSSSASSSSLSPPKSSLSGTSPLQDQRNSNSATSLSAATNTNSNSNTHAHATGGSNLFYLEVRHDELPRMNPTVTHDLLYRPATRFLGGVTGAGAGAGGVTYGESRFNQEPVNSSSSSSSSSSAGAATDGASVAAGRGDDEAPVAGPAPSYLSNDMINHLPAATARAAGASATTTSQLDRYNKSLIFADINYDEEEDEDALERFQRTRFQV